MENQKQDNGDQEHDTGSGPPKEPERTAEQLASIHAAMMEELGVGRKDTLVSFPSFIAVQRFNTQARLPADLPTSSICSVEQSKLGSSTI
jgi:hypothetical protein